MMSGRRICRAPLCSADAIWWRTMYRPALLKRLAMKYYPSEQLADEEIRISGKAAQLFVIEIEHLSGKEVQER